MAYVCDLCWRTLYVYLKRMHMTLFSGVFYGQVVCMYKEQQVLNVLADLLSNCPLNLGESNIEFSKFPVELCISSFLYHVCIGIIMAPQRCPSYDS